MTMRETIILAVAVLLLLPTTVHPAYLRKIQNSNEMTADGVAGYRAAGTAGADVIPEDGYKPTVVTEHSDPESESARNLSNYGTSSISGFKFDDGRGFGFGFGGNEKNHEKQEANFSNNSVNSTGDESISGSGSGSGGGNRGRRDVSSYISGSDDGAISFAVHGAGGLYGCDYYGRNPVSIAQINEKLFVNGKVCDPNGCEEDPNPLRSRGTDTESFNFDYIIICSDVHCGRRNGCQNYGRSNMTFINGNIFFKGNLCDSNGCQSYQPNVIMRRQNGSGIGSDGNSGNGGTSNTFSNVYSKNVYVNGKSISCWGYCYGNDTCYHYEYPVPESGTLPACEEMLQYEAKARQMAEESRQKILAEARQMVQESRLWAEEFRQRSEELRLNTEKFWQEFSKNLFK